MPDRRRTHSFEYEALFEPLRFLAFLAIPVALMLLTGLSYRGRVW
jgi:hypothetical protein